tara:strand:- start:388 stop:588 length:201 start_codon:yes stop_codon:yes gene_type:complete
MPSDCFTCKTAKKKAAKLLQPLFQIFWSNRPKRRPLFLLYADEQSAPLLLRRKAKLPVAPAPQCRR